MKSVYINSIGVCLPNDPIPCENLTRYIGSFSELDNRIESQIHSINGIQTRYYALDIDGRPTHLAQDLAFSASVEALARATNYEAVDIDLISVGTTIPDVMVPTLSHQLHGIMGRELGVGAVQVVPVAGVCLSGVTAMQIAHNMIQLEQKKCALIGGVERPSVALRKENYKEEYNRFTRNKDALAEDYSFINSQFLRWSLSDGAGCCILSDKSNTEGLSLRIDWIEINSYAHETPISLWSGSRTPHFCADDTWLAQLGISEAASKGLVGLKQDPEVVSQFLVMKATEELLRLQQKGCLDTSTVDWFLPHFGSYTYIETALKAFKSAGLHLGDEKWFTNLATKGNTGSAAVLIMLEEAMSNSVIQEGDKILLFVPEGARFNYGSIQLTCVSSES